MMLPLHDRLRSAIRTALSTLYALDRETSAIPLETPPNRAFGDVGSPVAFELARELRKAPRVIAQELAAALGPIDGVTAVSAAPNGYLNVFLDRARVPHRASRRARLRRRRTAARPSSSTRPSTRTRRPTSVTCATACLGDTLVRAAALPRHAGRGAELHRRHRRAGRRRRRRLPGISRASTSAQVARHRRHHALRLLLLGSLRPRHRVVRRRTRRAWRCAPRRSTTIEHGGRSDRPPSAPSSPTASSART